MLFQCQLLSGFQTYFVQIFLGIVALSTLWYKRTVERPKRSFEIWLLDVSKQGIGAIMGHIINLFIAIFLPPVTDECVWYFLNFLADVTLGTFLAIAFLRVQGEIAVTFNWTSIQDSGEYGNPVSYRIWSLQLGAWLTIILVSKCCITVILMSIDIALGHLGNWLFSPLKENPFAELLVVMVICPCFLNVVQFWIQDSFLKRNTTIFTRYLKPNQEGFDKELQCSLLSDSTQ